MVKTGTQHVQAVRTLDPVWARVREEAEAITKSSPELATFIFTTILNHEKLEQGETMVIPRRHGAYSEQG